ncbi:MAG: hypothetical protein ACP5U1_05350, partial [Desulfomonilaceae bacterium]
MLSFFWIIVILFTVLVIAQLVVFLNVRTQILSHPKLKLRKFHVLHAVLLVSANLVLAMISIGVAPTGE